MPMPPDKMCDGFTIDIATGVPVTWRCQNKATQERENENPPLYLCDACGDEADKQAEEEAQEEDL